MKLQIDTLLIDLVDFAPNWAEMTDAQAETYQLLLTLASLKGQLSVNAVRLSVLLELLHLTRPEPFARRLRNLQQKGLIKILGNAQVA